MSNRTLVEINHDLAHRFKDPAFLEALDRYTKSASPENAAELKKFGITVHGMRHHSESFNIRWGCHLVLG